MWELRKNESWLFIDQSIPINLNIVRSGIPDHFLVFTEDPFEGTSNILSMTEEQIEEKYKIKLR